MLKDKHNVDESEQDFLEKFRVEINFVELQQFLNKSAKVVETLLAENSASTSNFVIANKSDLEFSQGFTKFSIPKFLNKITKHAALNNCCFSIDDPNFLVCSYDLYSLSENKSNGTLFIVWNINDPENPHRLTNSVF